MKLLNLRRIAALAACCCAVVVMASQPLTPATGNPDQKNQHEAAREQSSSDDNAKTSPDRWAIKATVLNLVFSLGLVVLMFLQWLAMRAQARHMETGLALTGEAAKAAQASADAATISANTAKRALETLERADVLIEMVVVSSDHILEDMDITVVLRNYGRTRASNAICQSTLRVLGLSHATDPLGTVDTPMIIGAGATYEVRLTPIGQWLTTETISRINAVRLELQLVVAISYNDVFDREMVHHTTCYGLFAPLRGTFEMSQLEIG